MAPTDGAARAALAALHAQQGFTVYLRMPGQAASGSDAEQLGLVAPAFQDLPVGPAVCRGEGGQLALLLYAGAVATLAGSNDQEAGQQVLRNALGVRVSDRIYAMGAPVPLLAAGVPCAYRIPLRDTVTDGVERP